MELLWCFTNVQNKPGIIYSRFIQNKPLACSTDGFAFAFAQEKHSHPGDLGAKAARSEWRVFQSIVKFI